MEAARIFLGVSLAGMLGCAAALRSVPSPTLPLAASLSTSLTDLTDFASIPFGARRLAADVAWIQTLQYYGTDEEGVAHNDLENGRGRYNDFLTYCQRTTRLDPHFIYAYYYCAGALGWNLNRFDEAEALLKEGIQQNPTEWRFSQYLAAMAYQKNHNPEALMAFLESFAPSPDCPNLVRAMLANLYVKNKRYADAIRIWLQILDTGDRAYTDRAQQQIQKLSPLLTSHPPI